MTLFGKRSSPSEEAPDGAPGRGLYFWPVRLLFVVSLLIVGLAGPAVLIAAGLGGGNPAPVIFGILALSLALWVGRMIFSGQKKLQGMMRRVAERTGLTLSRTPDLMPGLSHLSLAGEVRGRWATIAFENLPVAGTTEYIPGGGKWHISRKRQHLVASVHIPTNKSGEKSEWIDLSLPARLSEVGKHLSDENAAWLREKGCFKIQLGGGRVAMAWDTRMTDEGIDEAVQGVCLLVEFADRLESKSGKRTDTSGACPLCGAAMTFNLRYPRAVCADCVRRAGDAEGRALDFFNADFGGGYLAIYREGGGKYDSHDCFIDGHPCRADEARFGGIVVQLGEVLEAAGS